MAEQTLKELNTQLQGQIKSLGVGIAIAQRILNAAIKMRELQDNLKKNEVYLQELAITLQTINERLEDESPKTTLDILRAENLTKRIEVLDKKYKELVGNEFSDVREQFATKG